LYDLGTGSSSRLASSHVPQLAAALDAALGQTPKAAAASGSRVSPVLGPAYDLSERQAQALLSVLLRPPATPSPATPSVEAQRRRSTVVDRGEALVRQWGCRACHQIGGRGGNVGGAFAEDQSPPSLDGIGQRFQAQWLERYLQYPEDQIMRPWLTARMPSYEMSPQERLDLVEYFLALDDVSAVHSSPPAGGRQDLLVGSLVFEILQCDRCHLNGGEDGGLEVQRLAPSYGLASRRLRPQWVVDWLLEPRRFRPSTSMPSYFGDGREQGLDYLSGTFDSPLFSQQQQRLLGAFDDEAAMEAYLSDRRRVATALRDYVWSLGGASNVR
jgi:mono/diheme cytochrome c family protein